jgi:hypothetical protein
VAVYVFPSPAKPSSASFKKGRLFSNFLNMFVKG